MFNEAFLEEVRTHHAELIKSGLKAAAEEPEISADLETELRDRFAPVPATQWSTEPELPAEGVRDLRLIDAISEGMGQAMETFPELVLMGQDIAEYGGVFKVTDGFVERFGKERVRNTPLCESAIVGAALGLSLSLIHISEPTRPY